MQNAMWNPYMWAMAAQQQMQQERQQQMLQQQMWLQQRAMQTGAGQQTPPPIGKGGANAGPQSHAAPGASAPESSETVGRTTRGQWHHINFTGNYYADLTAALGRQPRPSDRINSMIGGITFSQLTDLSGPDLVNAFPIKVRTAPPQPGGNGRPSEVACKFGIHCLREDCWYVHPDGRLIDDRRRRPDARNH